MQKLIIRPKTRLPLEKAPREILEIWRKVKGIWRKKKISPVLYLRKSRKEWEKRTL